MELLDLTLPCNGHKIVEEDDDGEEEDDDFDDSDDYEEDKTGSLAG